MKKKQKITKLFEYETHDQYIETQIERSRQKSGYCKVYFSDVLRYRTMIEMDRFGYLGKQSPSPRSPRILCLGVRNGAEVDLFRTVFYGPLLRLRGVQNYARRVDITALGEPKIRLARRLGIGSGKPQDGRVVGVEINPDSIREDVWIGSFDELPQAWTDSFDIIYSNSLDHAQDPEKTIAEWKRVAKPGAYVILGFTENKEVSDHDPFAGINYQLLQDMWGTRIVFLSDSLNQNGYREVCFRLAPSKSA